MKFTILLCMCVPGQNAVVVVDDSRAKKGPAARFASVHTKISGY